MQLKIMDYSLLLGIHDIIRGSEPEEEGPVREEESEWDGDCNLAGPPALVGSYGTSPEGIGGYIHSHRPLGPGEFESFIDVYAIRSAEGEREPGNVRGSGVMGTLGRQRPGWWVEKPLSFSQQSYLLGKRSWDCCTLSSLLASLPRGPPEGGVFHGPH